MPDSEEVGRTLADVQRILSDVQRTLGRLEGALEQVLKEQQLVRADLGDHKGEDRNNFAAVSARFGMVYKRLEQADEKRATLFAEQGVKLDSLTDYVSKIKGAWWLVGVLVLTIAGAGAAMTWVLELFRVKH